MSKHSPQVIVKSYEHYNRSLGKYITSKAHYEKEMKKQGMMSYDKAREVANKARKANMKPYTGISDKARAIINSARS